MNVSLYMCKSDVGVKNRELERRIMTKFICLAALLPMVVDSTLRVAFLSDLHIGESCFPVPYNGTNDCACIRNDLRAIEFINDLSPPPSAVIITGDITSSSWPSQWKKARELLDALAIPYYPIMGNHDVWQYDREGGNETLGPMGDAQFGATFGDLLRGSAQVVGYYNTTVHNPWHNCSSTFQNYQLNLVEPASGAKLAFLAGDWSTREAAPCANCSGVPGWAERGLSDFPGGTLPWLRQRLAEEAASPAPADRLFLVQHQPITCPFYMPDFSFCFGLADKLLLAEALEEQWPRTAYWGVIAGHNHLYLNQSTPFEGWPEFREVETSAAKGDGVDSDVASSVSVFTFEGTRVALIEEHSFRISTGEWSLKRGV